MYAVKRLKKYESEPFDIVLNLMKRGEIKPGRYSHLVKIDKNKIVKGKEFFNNVSTCPCLCGVP